MICRLYFRNQKESQFKQIIRKAVGKNESKAEDEEAFLDDEQPFIEEFPVAEKNEPHIITRPIIDFNKPKETAVQMPEHDFLNPYKNQNPGDIKIIDTADKIFLLPARLLKRLSVKK